MATGCIAPSDPSDTEQGLGDTVKPDPSTPGAPADADGPCPVPNTLAYHVTQITKADKFEYDPVGDLVQLVKGHYHDRNGRFNWQERFRDDSYLHHRHVRGEATSFDTTQVLSYEVETTDVLDDVTATEVEETWNGCEVERRFRPAGGTDQDWRDHHGSYDGFAYTYLEEQTPYMQVNQLPIILVSGIVFPDQAWIEQAEHSGSPDYYQTRTGDGSGYEFLSWEKNYGDAVYYGFVETYVDGSRHHHSRYYTDGDGCTSGWRDLNIAYDGHGTGIAEICDFSSDEYGVPVMCDLTVAPGACTETCANGTVTVRDSCLQ